MTDKAQPKPFWVVFGPSGSVELAEESGLVAKLAFAYLMEHESTIAVWERYEQLGYRCLECVVKEKSDDAA